MLLREDEVAGDVARDPCVVAAGRPHEVDLVESADVVGAGLALQQDLERVRGAESHVVEEEDRAERAVDGDAPIVQRREGEVAETGKSRYAGARRLSATGNDRAGSSGIAGRMTYKLAPSCCSKNARCASSRPVRSSDPLS